MAPIQESALKRLASWLQLESIRKQPDGTLVLLLASTRLRPATAEDLSLGCLRRLAGCAQFQKPEPAENSLDELIAYCDRTVEESGYVLLGKTIRDRLVALRERSQK